MECTRLRRTAYRRGSELTQSGQKQPNKVAAQNAREQTLGPKAGADRARTHRPISYASRRRALGRPSRPCCGVRRCTGAFQARDNCQLAHRCQSANRDAAQICHLKRRNIVTPVASSPSGGCLANVTP